MDTISRENNSILPAVGVALGAVALLVAAWSALSLSKVKTTLAAHEEKLSQIDGLQTQVSALSDKTDKLRANMDQSTPGSFADQVQKAFNLVATQIGNINGELTKLQESRGPAARGKGHGGPVVAGPGEYIVKAKDNLAKIARNNGCSLSDLEAVNPGVNSKSLKIGQKLKLPEKGGAAAAPADASAPAAAPAPAQ